MEPLEEARVLAGTAPIALSQKPSRKALSGLEVRLSTGDITRSVSSWEEVRHDRTSRSRALGPGPPSAPAPKGTRNSPCGLIETRGPLPSLGHPPHTLLCSRPSSRSSRSQKPGGSSPPAGGRSLVELFYLTLHRGLEPCADPRLGRLLPRSLPPTRRSTPWGYVAFLLPRFD